jgi:hypothetical protein
MFIGKMWRREWMEGRHQNWMKASTMDLLLFVQREGWLPRRPLVLELVLFDQEISSSGSSHDDCGMHIAIGDQRDGRGV